VKFGECDQLPTIRPMPGTLAEAIALRGDPAVEPARGQVVRVGGREVLMTACLERTAVVELDGRRELVRHDRVDVDEAAVRWQARELDDSTPRVPRRRRSDAA
jgi:hypothetical protein